jgi:hypothetical protein
MGLEKLSEIREELELPQLNLELVEGSIAVVTISDEVTVSEEAAIKSCSFEHTGEIVLSVPINYWEPFLQFGYTVERSPFDGQITTIRPHYTVDKTAVVKFWENNGYFRYWRIVDGKNVFAYDYESIFGTATECNTWS